MKRGTVICSLLVFVGIGCGPPPTPEEERQMQIVHELGCHLQCVPAGSETVFSVEKLSDGYAILVEFRTKSGVPDAPCAYWTHGGEFYAVNDAAVRCSPELSLAPEGITFEAITKAILEAPEHSY